MKWNILISILSRLRSARSFSSKKYDISKLSNILLKDSIVTSAIHSHIVGFDDYYLSLRPRIGDECGGQAENNIPHKFLKKKMVNCRNIWFREFWSQHHKCTFNVNASSSVTRCTGEENLVDYEQEGLVPFVGNVQNYFIVILTFFSKSILLYVHRKKNMTVNLHRYPCNVSSKKI